MSASFPANLIYVKRYDDQKKNILLMENKPEIIKLTDGRKIHLLIENPETKKTVPLTEDPIPKRYVLAFAFLFVVLAICMICTLIASV